jgi:hypothetical protein
MEGASGDTQLSGRRRSIGPMFVQHSLNVALLSIVQRSTHNMPNAQSTAVPRRVRPSTPFDRWSGGTRRERPHIPRLPGATIPLVEFKQGKRGQIIGLVQIMGHECNALKIGGF